jgi:uncharacterized damage-inducible protein DinB
MKPFFKELFTYCDFFNGKIIEILNENQAVIPQKTIRLFNHTLNAHQIWNSRILNQTPFGVWDIHALEDLATINKKNQALSLEIIDQYDFEQVITYKNSRGEQFSKLVRDILFHVVNHSTYHRGQIMADLREHNIEPVSSDYIFYAQNIC